MHFAQALAPVAKRCGIVCNVESIHSLVHCMLCDVSALHMGLRVACRPRVLHCAECRVWGVWIDYVCACVCADARVSCRAGTFGARMVDVVAVAFHDGLWRHSRLKLHWPVERVAAMLVE